MTTTEITHPAPGRLAAYTAGSAAAALAVVVLAVLPAEYGVDPTGFGAATGILALSEPPEFVVETRLSAPPEVATRPATAWREDTVTIRVGGMAENWGQVEYKITVASGDDVVYRWEADRPLWYEFHGHTLAEDGEQMTVMDYIADEGTASQGRLTAPIDGIHGWFFRNDGFEPVEVTLHLAGFYELAPGVIEFQRVD
ncbi:hypothetical protein HKCCE2091_03015 [Rhodobacterales bacterium HKCCE2091]|nr:hypothetical protein [Rhodobacterales bacterium HKCCE2091]